MAKIRLDVLVTERGIAPSRERARAYIIAGRMMVNEQKIDKPGAAVDPEAVLRLLGDELRYVSRGGLKLEGALKLWQIDVTERWGLDVGASTGGFTDCLLQHGAARVTAVDTGFGQIAMKLRQDERVRLMERCNARLLEPGALLDPEGNGPTIMAMDVSFISATLILPAIFAAAPTLTEAVVLVKPQFEAGREHVGRGGIVRDPKAHKLAVDKVAACVKEQGWRVAASAESPITGAEGNHEFLLWARKAESET
ncbi:TlyA family RNA methyltransferase [Telmatobacter bradus]|uniref:TlyA family RNA methyltransferase n=1 Tax=Telmatobacter bradus TaxID=474953 RepID=UPI003B428E4A